MKEKIRKFITNKDGNPCNVSINWLFKNPKNKDMLDAFSVVEKGLDRSETVYLFLNDMTHAPRCHHGVKLKFIDFARNYANSFCECTGTEEYDLIREDFIKWTGDLETFSSKTVNKNPRWKEAINNFSDGKTFKEKVYLFLNNQPKGTNCECGKRLKVIAIKAGYSSKFCSQTCEPARRNSSNRVKRELAEGTRKNLSEIVFEKYGTFTPPGSAEKREATMMKRYGVSSSLQLPETKEKIKAANIAKHGVEYPFQCPEFRKAATAKAMIVTNNMATTRQAFLDQNNGLNPFVVYKDEITDHWADLGVNHPKQLHYSETTRDILFNPDKLEEYVKGREFNVLVVELGINSSTLYRYLKQHKLLDIVSAKTRSLMEAQLRQRLHDMGYEGQFVTGNRSILGDMEFDFYFNDKKIAIELNGLYWHREEIRDSEYHRTKYRRAKEAGIELYQFWEDDWNNRQDVVMNNIANILSPKIPDTYSFVSNIDQLIYDYDLRVVDELVNMDDVVFIGGFLDNELVSGCIIDGNVITAHYGYIAWEALSAMTACDLFVIFDHNYSDYRNLEIIHDIEPVGYWTECNRFRFIEQKDELEVRVFDSGKSVCYLPYS